MQDAAFEALGLDWRYLPFDVLPENFAPAVEGLRALGFVGANVTVPHKHAALMLADVIEASAESVGACNVLMFSDSKVRGLNSDAHGFKQDLQAHFGPRMVGATVLVMGAGGAARAVVEACAGDADRVIVMNRSVDRATSIIESFQSEQSATRYEARVLNEDAFNNALSSATLVVQTTSCGMYPHIDATPVAWPDTVPKDLCVYDVIYNPRKTRFMREAAARGAKVCDGLGMLVEQGALAFEIWTGQSAPREVMRAAAELAMQRMVK